MQRRTFANTQSLTCFVMLSSIWNRVSSPRDLIPCNRAVAMFMWVSSVCFRAVNSGNAVIAAFKLAAFDERSLRDMGKYQSTSVLNSATLLTSVKGR